MSYGEELILDLHNCNPKRFTREHLEEFCKGLCELIDMERGELFFWDYQDEPEEYEKAPDHLKGTSCVQFITTSNITIHTLDVLKRVYFNLFSCKDFDNKKVVEYVGMFFDGSIVQKAEIGRR